MSPFVVVSERALDAHTGTWRQELTSPSPIAFSPVLLTW